MRRRLLSPSLHAPHGDAGKGPENRSCRIRALVGLLVAMVALAPATAAALTGHGPFGLRWCLVHHSGVCHPSRDRTVPIAPGPLVKIVGVDAFDWSVGAAPRLIATLKQPLSGARTAAVPRRASRPRSSHRHRTAAWTRKHRTAARGHHRTAARTHPRKAAKHSPHRRRLARKHDHRTSAWIPYQRRLFLTYHHRRLARTHQHKKAAQTPNHRRLARNRQHKRAAPTPNHRRTVTNHRRAVKRTHRFISHHRRRTARARRHNLHRARHRPALPTVAAHAASPAPAPIVTVPAPQPPAFEGWRPFNSASPYNTPLPANPVLDRFSAVMIAGVTREGHADAMLHEFGNPVVEAPAGTPGVNVRVENHWSGFYEGSVPIPARTAASVGSDASLVVIDRSSGAAYDFWQMKWTGSEWVAGYATRFSVMGTGAPPEAMVGATGSNIPLLACMIRVSEIEAGVIPHAIDIATSLSASSFRFPATKSDGHNPYPPGLPEGARLQLDPSINLAAIPGISSAEVAIGRAAQVYGIYVRNTTSPAMAVGFEDAGPVTPASPYYKAGLTSDGFRMSHIPWGSLRVLARWDGG
ncbi:MAG: hypothetical protein JWO23_661 [Solirubrobacterales bacterium]|nr:hypothetical protein [Solirubrobacterales bacterium]